MERAPQSTPMTNTWQEEANSIIANLIRIGPVEHNREAVFEVIGGLLVEKEANLKSALSSQKKLIVEALEKTDWRHFDEECACKMCYGHEKALDEAIKLIEEI